MSWSLIGGCVWESSGDSNFAGRWSQWFFGQSSTFYLSLKALEVVYLTSWLKRKQNWVVNKYSKVGIMSTYFWGLKTTFHLLINFIFWGNASLLLSALGINLFVFNSLFYQCKTCACSLHVNSNTYDKSIKFPLGQVVTSLWQLARFKSNCCKLYVLSLFWFF